MDVKRWCTHQSGGAELMATEACAGDDGCPLSKPDSKRSFSSFGPEGSSASSTKLYRRELRDGRTDEARTDRKKLVRERVAGSSDRRLVAVLVVAVRELSPALQAFMEDGAFWASVQT